MYFNFFLAIEVLYLFLAKGSTMRGTIEVLFLYLFLTTGLTMRGTIEVLLIYEVPLFGQTVYVFLAVLIVSINSKKDDDARYDRDTVPLFWPNHFWLFNHCNRGTCSILLESHSWFGVRHGRDTPMILIIISEAPRLRPEASFIPLPLFFFFFATR